MTLLPNDCDVDAATWEQVNMRSATGRRLAAHLAEQGYGPGTPIIDVNDAVIEFFDLVVDFDDEAITAWVDDWTCAAVDHLDGAA